MVVQVLSAWLLMTLAVFGQDNRRTTVPRPEKYVPRSEWGSNPDAIPENRRHDPQRITIHHAGVLWTNSKQPERFLRDMQSWGKKRPAIEKPPRNTYWPDLPYHFLIAPDGRIFEGRPVEFEPESNTKYPLAGHLGVELMGDFNRQRPSKAQLESLVRLTAWLMQQHRVSFDNVLTHRDVAPGQTSCPGDDLYRYMRDGQFRTWVRTVIAGEELELQPGPPLSNGPRVSITETTQTSD